MSKATFLEMLVLDQIRPFIVEKFKLNGGQEMTEDQVSLDHLLYEKEGGYEADSLDMVEFVEELVAWGRAYDPEFDIPENDEMSKASRTVRDVVQNLIRRGLPNELVDFIRSGASETEVVEDVEPAAATAE